MQGEEHSNHQKQGHGLVVQIACQIPLGEV